VLHRGELQTAIGTGFQPGEVVSGVQYSDPYPVGTQRADVDGTVTFTWVIPADTDISEHTITLTGEESGDVSGTFRVAATATDGGTDGSSGGGGNGGSGGIGNGGSGGGYNGGSGGSGGGHLPNTGSELGSALPMGLLLLGAGAALFATSRKFAVTSTK
jgi:LPXTG-motif cell wall-anchored protein